MSTSYEDLMGALGRAVYYRPERRRIRDLLSREAGAVVIIDDAPYPLFDISLNGLSFLSSSKTLRWGIGETVELTVAVRGQPAFRNRARIVRSDRAGGGLRIAVTIVAGFIDLAALLRLDEETRLHTELGDGPESIRQQVPPDYRAVVEQAVHLAQHYRRSLGRHEARYRVEGSDGQQRIEELTVRAADALRPRWWELEEAGSEASARFLGDGPTLRAAKEYTETVLTPLLIDAPMIRRSYTKPLGYAGDYQVMLYYYANAFEGESVFARVFHKFFVEHPLSNGVRTRMDYVVELMRDEHRRLAAHAPAEMHFRVTSLGCGPAREVSEYAARVRTWPGEITWTLVDQEEETLAVAFHSGHRDLARVDGRGQIACLNLSFAQILQDPAVLGLGETQHFIFSTGLFDYLREPRAQGLIEGLYAGLAPGGLLAIGNALAPNAHFWSPEMILDWTLLYRTEDEMRRMTARLPTDAEVRVTVEPGRAYYFVLVRKPR